MNGRQNEVAPRAARIYERLLAVYPARHRRQYGPQMVQLFRDQCRDALEREGWAGLVGLWCRVLWDTAKTSVVEHIAAIQRIDFMKMSSQLTTWNWLAGVAVGVAAFLLVVTTSIVVTALLPRYYRSVARVVAAKPTEGPGAKGIDFNDPDSLQTQFERLTSRDVLYPVIDELGLNRTWASRYRSAQPLTRQQTYLMLKRRIGLRRFQGYDLGTNRITVNELNTKVDLRRFPPFNIIEVSVFSEDRDEAAAIANKVVDVYRSLTSPSPHRAQVEISDRAEPGLRPVRPNPYLNLFAGASAGSVVGVLSGALALLIQGWLKARKAPNGAVPG